MANSSPDAWALRDPYGSFTWSELWFEVTRGIAVVDDLALAPQERIAVMFHNSRWAVLGYLATLHAGASVIPISCHLTAAEVAYILKDGRAGAVLCDRSSEQVVRAAASQVGIEKIVVWPDSTDTDDQSHWSRSITGASAKSVDRSRRPRPNLLYTSGTTGFPKGVERPPVMPSTLGEFLDSLVEKSTAGPYLVCGPLYHTGPLRSIQRLAGGRPLFVQPSFDAETTLAVIDRERITGTLMVPTHFIRLLDLPVEVRDNYDVTSMESLDHTGAACPLAVKQAMINWFGPVLTEKYGGTESGSLCSITSQEWLENPGSVGKCISPFEVLVVDDDGVILPPTTNGRLFFRDTTGRGISYYGAPEKTAEVHLAPDVFTVGDSGYVDLDGYVFITGRHSDMVLSGGVNLYPAESERVLRTHPAVVDVAVIGVPNKKMGEELKALVVCANPSVSEMDLIEFCRANLAHPKCPRSVEFVADLNRNDMGKVNKRELAASYWKQESEELTM